VPEGTASGPEPKPERLFVAFTLPEHAATAVERAIEPWHEAFPTMRWTPKENYHVTLRFLGSTPVRLVPWVGERLADAAGIASVPSTRIRGLGSFPARGRARVLWAGLDDERGALARLAGSIRGALAPEFPLELAPFSPHVTVARSRAPSDLPPEFAATFLESEPFSVGTIVLMRSRLRRPAPIYEPIRTFALTGTN